MLSSKTVRLSGIRLACALAVASFGAGALAADVAGPADAKAPPKIMTKVKGTAGPTTAQAAPVKVTATSQSSDSSSQDQRSEPTEHIPSNGPMKVKPGVGPGQGDGIESIGPAPR